MSLAEAFVVERNAYGFSLPLRYWYHVRTGRVIEVPDEYGSEHTTVVRMRPSAFGITARELEQVDDGRDALSRPLIRLAQRKGWVRAGHEFDGSGYIDAKNAADARMAIKHFVEVEGMPPQILLDWAWTSKINQVLNPTEIKAFLETGRIVARPALQYHAVGTPAESLDWQDTDPHRPAENVPYLVNPTREVLLRAVHSVPSGEVRGRLIGSDAYWWDAALMIHPAMAQKLGVQGFNWKSTPNRLFLRRGREDGDTHYIVHYDERVKDHPAIKRLRLGGTYAALLDVPAGWKPKTLVAAEGRVEERAIDKVFDRAASKFISDLIRRIERASVATRKRWLRQDVDEQGRLKSLSLDIHTILSDHREAPLVLQIMPAGDSRVGGAFQTGGDVPVIVMTLPNELLQYDPVRSLPAFIRQLGLNVYHEYIHYLRWLSDRRNVAGAERQWGAIVRRIQQVLATGGTDADVNRLYLNSPDELETWFMERTKEALLVQPTLAQAKTAREFVTGVQRHIQWASPNFWVALTDENRKRFLKRLTTYWYDMFETPASAVSSIRAAPAKASRRRRAEAVPVVELRYAPDVDMFVSDFAPMRYTTSMPLSEESMYWCPACLVPVAAPVVGGDRVRCGCGCLVEAKERTFTREDVQTFADLCLAQGDSEKVTLRKIKDRFELNQVTIDPMQKVQTPELPDEDEGDEDDEI
jgi:hypothetical protein